MTSDTGSDASKKRDQGKHEEDMIDESVKDSFPASDPPSVGGTTKIGSEGTEAGEKEDEVGDDGGGSEDGGGSDDTKSIGGGKAHGDRRK